MKVYSVQSLLLILFYILSLIPSVFAGTPSPKLASSDIEELPVVLGTNQRMATQALVPIELPPGTAQLTPSLGLQYDSQLTHNFAGDTTGTHCYIAYKMSKPNKFKNSLIVYRSVWDKRACYTLISVYKSLGKKNHYIKWAQSGSSTSLIEEAIVDGKCYALKQDSSNDPRLKFWKERKNIDQYHCLFYSIYGDRTTNHNDKNYMFKWAAGPDLPAVYDNSPIDYNRGDEASHWSLSGVPFVQQCHFEPLFTIDPVSNQPVLTDSQVRTFELKNKPKIKPALTLCLVDGQQQQLMELVSIDNQQSVYRLLDEQGNWQNHLHITLTGDTLLIDNRISGQQQRFKRPKSAKPHVYLINEMHVKPFTNNRVVYKWEQVNIEHHSGYRISNIKYGRNVSDMPQDNQQQHFNHIVNFNWFDHRVTSFPLSIRIESLLTDNADPTANHEERYRYELNPKPLLKIAAAQTTIHDKQSGLVCNIPHFFHISACDYPSKRKEPGHIKTDIDFHRISSIRKTLPNKQSQQKIQQVMFAYQNCATGSSIGCLRSIINGDAKEEWAKKTVITEKIQDQSKAVEFYQSNNTNGSLEIGDEPQKTFILGSDSSPYALSERRLKRYQTITKTVYHANSGNKLISISQSNRYKGSKLVVSRKTTYSKKGETNSVQTESWSYDPKQPQVHTHNVQNIKYSANSQTGKLQSDVTTTILNKTIDFPDQATSHNNASIHSISVPQQVTVVSAVNGLDSDGSLSDTDIHYAVREQVLQYYDNKEKWGQLKSQTHSHCYHKQHVVFHSKPICKKHETVAEIAFDTPTSFTKTINHLITKQHYTIEYSPLGVVTQTKHIDNDFFLSNNSDANAHIMSYNLQNGWKLVNIRDNQSNIWHEFGPQSHSGQLLWQKSYMKTPEDEKRLSYTQAVVDPLFLTTYRTIQYDDNNTILSDVSISQQRPTSKSATAYASITNDQVNKIESTQSFNRWGQTISAIRTKDNKTVSRKEWEYYGSELTKQFIYDKDDTLLSTTEYKYDTRGDITKVTKTAGKHTYTTEYNQQYKFLGSTNTVQHSDAQGNLKPATSSWSTALSRGSEDASSLKTTVKLEYWGNCHGITAYHKVNKVVTNGQKTVTNKQCFNSLGQLVMDDAQEGSVTHYRYHNNGLVKSIRECSHTTPDCDPKKYTTIYTYYDSDGTKGKVGAIKSITNDQQINTYEYQPKTGYLAAEITEYTHEDIKKNSLFSKHYQNIDDYGRPQDVIYNVDLSFKKIPIQINESFAVKRKYKTDKNAHQLSEITYPKSLNDMKHGLPGVVASLSYDEKGSLQELDLNIDGRIKIPQVVQHGFQKEFKTGPTHVHFLKSGRITFDNNPSAKNLVTKHLVTNKYEDFVDKTQTNGDIVIGNKNTIAGDINDTQSTTYVVNNKGNVTEQYHQLGKQKRRYDYVEGYHYNKKNRLTRTVMAPVKPIESATDDMVPMQDYTQHTNTFNTFGEIDSNRFYLNHHPLHQGVLTYNDSDSLRTQLADTVKQRLDGKLPWDISLERMPLTITTDGLVDKFYSTDTNITLDYNTNQRLTHLTSYTTSKQFNTHLLYDAGQQVAITVETTSQTGSNGCDRYHVSIELDDIYKWVQQTSDVSCNEKTNTFAYSYLPSGNRLNRVVVRHGTQSITANGTYSVDVLNYQYDRLGSMIAQQGPTLNWTNPKQDCDGNTNAVGNNCIDHLITLRFTPWGKRILFPDQGLPSDEIPPATHWDLAEKGIDTTQSFTGQRSLLGSNLLLMGDYRLYSPELQRFINPDDRDTGSGFSAYNRKMYANNNPVRYVDPDGHAPLLVENFFKRLCCSCSPQDIDDCDMSGEGRVIPLPMVPPIPLGAITLAVIERPEDIVDDIDPLPEYSSKYVLPVASAASAALALTYDEFKEEVRKLKKTYGSTSLMIEMSFLVASTIGTGVALKLENQMGARFGLSLCHGSARASLSCAKLLVVTASEELGKTWRYAIGSMLIFSGINSGTGILVDWNEKTNYLKTDPKFFIGATVAYAGVTSLFDQYTSRYGGLALRWIQYLIKKPQGWINPDTRELTPKGKAHGYYAGYMILEPISIILVGWTYARALNNHFGNFPVGPFVGYLSLYTGVRVIGGAMGFEVLLRRIENRGTNYRDPFAELNSRIPTTVLATLVAVAAAGQL